jgi:hypothetical protein
MTLLYSKSGFDTRKVTRILYCQQHIIAIQRFRVNVLRVDDPHPHSLSLYEFRCALHVYEVEEFVGISCSLIICGAFTILIT